MGTKNFGSNLGALAAEIEWYAERLERIEELQRTDESNPLFVIAMLIAEEILPIFRGHSPEDTGMLKSYHRIGERWLEVSTRTVIAGFDIDINPSRARENPKYGGFPIDYGPAYHQEKRPWFSQAMQDAIPVVESLTAKQFKSWIEVWAW